MRPYIAFYLHYLMSKMHKYKRLYHPSGESAGVLYKKNM